NRRAYSCNAKEEIWFFERYTVSGKIEENGTLSLKETAYQIPANDACEPTGARYLDSFTGILAGDTVRLKSNEDKIEQTLERKYGVSPVTSWGKFTSPLGQPKSTQRNFSITK
ncbi:hypothetical protein KKF84_11250, partial [Myxococcota bacterium]|nr:hypothetical protein [Myxococcota bacterium]